MSNLVMYFIVQAYERELPDGSLLDLCTLELRSNTASDAIERAKKLIEKKHYRIAKVIETKEE